MAEADDSRVLEIAALRRALRDGWYLVLSAVLLGVMAGAAYGLLAVPRYTAESRIYVTVIGASSVPDLVQGADYAQQVLQSYSEVARSPLVLDRVRSSLGIAGGSDALAAATSVAPIADTSLLDIQVTWSSPTGAADIANSVTQQLTEVSNQLSRDDKDDATIRLTQIAAARSDGPPIAPNRPLAILTGVVAGLVIGVLLALLRALGSTRIRSEADLTALFPAPLLGVTLLERRRQSGLEIRETAGSVASERYRAVRTNLRYLTMDEPIRVLLVTSALPGEGKTVFASNLAVALAQAGRTVVLVDADLRRPGVAARFGLDGGVGLSDALTGESDLNALLQEVGGVPGLRILPAGSIPPNPSELMGSSVMQALLSRLLLAGEVLVILDAPPILPVADPAVLAPEADAVLLLAAAGRSRRTTHLRAFATLRGLGVERIATVLTMVQHSSRDPLYKDYRR